MRYNSITPSPTLASGNCVKTLHECSRTHTSEKEEHSWPSQFQKSLPKTKEKHLLTLFNILVVRASEAILGLRSSAMQTKLSPVDRRHNLVSSTSTALLQCPLQMEHRARESDPRSLLTFWASSKPGSHFFGSNLKLVTRVKHSSPSAVHYQADSP